MSNLSGVARPYAYAAFNCAVSTQQVSEWKVFLETAATLAQNSTVASLLPNPEIKPDQILSLFFDILTPYLNDERKNFLKLLSVNKRFPALPAMSLLFNTCCAEQEKISRVHLVTAVETDQAFRQQLQEALVKRMQQNITLTYEVQPDIIAGAKIYLNNNQVIDGSIIGKLNRLLEFSLR